MMKSVVLKLSVAVILFASVLNTLTAQEKPKPKKDTVNMDTYAKPVFYYAAEEEQKSTKGSSGTTIVIIGGIVVVVGVAGYYLLKKKN
jgi:LPXTG-motif cell wall-anchored protein